MANISVPSLDFSEGLGTAPKYGYGAGGAALSGLEGFVTGMQNARKMQQENMKMEQDRRRIQMQEQESQMRMREVELRLETIKMAREESSKKMKAQEIFAEGLKKRGEMDPSAGIDDYQQFVSGTYDALKSIGAYDEATQWMQTIGSASEEQKRMITLENERTSKVMQSEMNNVARLIEKMNSLASPTNNNGWGALSQEEQAALGGRNLTPDQWASIYQRSSVAGKNYDYSDVIKNTNTLRSEWMDSKRKIFEEMDPKKRIELAIQSDNYLADLEEVYKMYAPVPVVSMSIQSLPQGWQSRSIDDAMIYAFDFYDKRAKEMMGSFDIPLFDTEKESKSKSAAQEAAKIREEYEKITGETIEAGRARIREDELRRIKWEKSNAAGGIPATPSGSVPMPKPAPSAKQAGQSQSPLSATNIVASSDQKVNDQATSRGGIANPIDVGAPPFKDYNEAAAWMFSPEGQKHVGKAILITVGDKTSAYVVRKK